MTGFLLAVCLTCAGDLDMSKLPDSCEVIVVAASDWGSALDMAIRDGGYTSAYLLDEEDGVWLRRTGGPAWCELPD